MIKIIDTYEDSFNDHTQNNVVIITMVLQSFNDGYFETRCKLLMAPTVLAVITWLCILRRRYRLQKTTFQYNICTIFQIPGFYFSGL